MADFNFNLKPPDSIPGQAAYGAYGVFALWRRVNAIGSGGGGGGTPSLTSTYIAYGDTNNQLTGDADFMYNPGVGFTVSFSGNPVIKAGAFQVSLGDLSGGAGSGTRIDIDDTLGHITVGNVPAFANDAAAITGGLITGMLYKTTALGSTFLKIVP